MMSLLFLVMPHAHALPAFCQEKVTAKMEKRISLSDEVNYFARAGKNKLSFATNNGNRVLDLETQKFSSLPGLIDPVISPDGELVAVPVAKIFDPKTKQYTTVSTSDEKNRMNQTKTWFLGDMVIKNSINPKTGSREFNEHYTHAKSRAQLEARGETFAIGAMDFFRQGADGNYSSFYSDNDLGGNYQSIGILKSSTDSKKYRMIFEREDSFYFRDYSLDRGSGRMTPIGDVSSLCGQSKIEGSLPMINKDGTEFTVYLPTDDVTKVYAINRMNGTCQAKDTIPALVGKTDFSPSNKLLAFHMDQKSSVTPSEFRTPMADDILRVFVFDRETKKMTPIHGQAGEDSYYPVFLDEDRIAFISASKGEGRKFFVNVVHLESSPSLECSDCDPKTRKGQMAAILGRLYNRKCELPNDGFRQAFTGFSRLSPESCRALTSSLSAEDLELAIFPANLTDSHWNWSLIKDLKLDELKSLCHGPGAEKSSGAKDTIK